jgi:hypothetical protein
MFSRSPLRVPTNPSHNDLPQGDRRLQAAGVSSMPSFVLPAIHSLRHADVIFNREAVPRLIAPIADLLGVHVFIAGIPTEFYLSSGTIIFASQRCANTIEEIFTEYLLLSI